MNPDQEYTYQSQSQNESMNQDLSHKKVIIVADGAFPTHPEPLRLLQEADFVVCCDGAAASLTGYGIEPGIIIGDLDSLSDELAERYSDRLLPDPDQETNDLTKAVNWCIVHRATDLTILGATGKREDHTLGNISLLASYGKLKATSATPADNQGKPEATYYNSSAAPSLNSPAAAPPDNHGKLENNHYNPSSMPAESFGNPSDSGSEPSLNSTAAGPTGSSENPEISQNNSNPADLFINPDESAIKVKMVTDTGILFPVYGTCTIKTFPGQPVSIFSLDSTAEVTSSGLKYPLNKVILSGWWTATLNIATGTTFTLTLSPAPLIIYLGHPQP